MIFSTRIPRSLRIPAFEEFIEKVKCLLDNETERQANARAGQQRTLNCHTMRHRCEQIHDIIDRALQRGRGIAKYWENEMITIAQLGCEFWGFNLLRNLWANPNCRVGTVIDTSRERRSYVEQNFPGVSTSDDLSEVLLNPNIDAVVIATPAASHHELTKSILLAGKHVLFEKPLAKWASEAEELA